MQRCRITHLLDPVGFWTLRRAGVEGRPSARWTPRKKLGWDSAPSTASIHGHHGQIGLVESTDSEHVMRLVNRKYGRSSWIKRPKEG